MAAGFYTTDGELEDYYEFRFIRTHKIRFRVQAERDVVICLSSNDCLESILYLIVIGCNEGSESVIRRGLNDEVLRMETPDILSPDEYRGFWIKITRGVLKVGKKGRLTPFMKFEDPEYLTGVRCYGYATLFGATGSWNFSDEKGEDDSSSSSSSGASSSDSEAENLDTMEIRPIMYKRPARWVPGFGGYIPRHPVSGGMGSSGEVYVGMASHEEGYILGMVVPEEQLCYIPFGGEAVAKEEYYILCNPGSVTLDWKPGSAGAVPVGALEGGFSEDGDVLYIGRVCVDGIVSCGKVHPSHGVCYVPYDGAEHSHRDYEVLCAKQIPFRLRN